MGTIDFENPELDWVTARLAEMDAALAEIERRNAALGDDLRTLAEGNSKALLDARERMEQTVRDTLEEQRNALPRLKEELAPIWDSFETTLMRWLEIAGSQDEVLSAQLRAQTVIWDDFFDRYRGAVAKTGQQTRAALLRQLDAASRQLTQFQMKAASLADNPPAVMTKALDQSRRAAEEAAADFQATLARMKL